jgi:sulfur-oxidizing protein SoxY
MIERTWEICATRRELLAATAGFAGAVLLPPDVRAGDDPVDPVELISKLTGKIPIESDRVRIDMPRVFPNGYSVPLALTIESPMTDLDHVRQVRVFAPRNPIIEVVAFTFSPGRSEPRVSTRIRLAEPQHVLAAAEMQDGSLLFNRTWVAVSSNGCK